MKVVRVKVGVLVLPYQKSDRSENMVEQVSSMLSLHSLPANIKSKVKSQTKIYLSNFFNSLIKECYSKVQRNSILNKITKNRPDFS